MVRVSNERMILVLFKSASQQVFLAPLRSSHGIVPLESNTLGASTQRGDYNDLCVAVAACR
jgi:hypothetical protein